MLAVYIPSANPLNFTQEGYSPAAQYNSKHIADFQFEETIRKWQHYTNWYQPWQLNDSINLQVLSQMDPVEMTILDIDGVPVFSAPLQQLQQSFFDPTLYIYQLSLALNIFPEGYYKMVLKFGSPVTLTVVSNTFEIRTKFEDSLLIGYKNFKHYADIYFENGFSPSLRIIGTLAYEKPGARNTLYENQDNDMTLLDVKPFNTYRLYTGGPEGIPDWAITKYNIIVGCSTLNIDGRLYSKASDSASFDLKEEKDYPLKGWSIELRDKLNRQSKIWNFAGIGPGINNLGLSVVVNVETKGFVNDDQGGSYYEVQDVE